MSCIILKTKRLLLKIYQACSIQILGQVGGKLVNIHQGQQGIPEIQHELLPKLRGTLGDSYTIEEIDTHLPELVNEMKMNKTNIEMNKTNIEMNTTNFEMNNEIVFDVERHDIPCFLDLQGLTTDRGTKSGGWVVSVTCIVVYVKPLPFYASVCVFLKNAQ